ncbi:MAG: hypothetical protein K2H72_03500 [Muribaculaceae bacterium]|nr:hypothetical protein [Muribaculaceae bacterium]
MKKRYDVKGMMEWHTEFKVGRSRLQVSFTGGHMCGGASTPASFETSDPVVQAIIEGSPAFKNGRIRVGSVTQTASTDRQPQPPSAESSASVVAEQPAEGSGAASQTTVVEYKTKTGASDFLQFEKGIPIERLLTAEDCIAEARKIGIDLRINSKEGAA